MITMKRICAFLCVLPFVLAGPFPNFRSTLDFVSFEHPKQWWQTASFYQIYPRSFKDSDGDGIGDLNGITENLSYLKEIGVTAAWLSPIFKSPMVDFGYDISDYFQIEEDYGTMEDFERMIEKANELDIKIILDFVPNHSSDQNEWFKKSVKKEPGFENFYVWHSGEPNPNNSSKPNPPKNWVSVFRGSAWTWNDERKQYYLHQFSKGQPDLNYRDPKVQDMMESVLRFWLDKGVYGFRIDAVPFVYECSPIRDEPRNHDVNDPNDYGYLKHDCTVDQAETLQLVYKWRAILDDVTQKSKDKLQRIMMTEAYSPLDTVMKYYGDDSQEGSQIPFNFLFITSLNNVSTANDFVKVVNTWMDNMPKGRTANWVMGNHDQARVASRFGIEKKDLMNMILLSLPGASVTYNGEEIGMKNVWISWEDTKDPAGCNAGKDKYEQTSRDPERTPFQWSDDKNAGFSEGDKTWLPVAPDYKDVNVRKQRTDVRSTLNIYKVMQFLRKSSPFTDGGLQVKALSENVLGIMRSTALSGSWSYVTLVNLGDREKTVSLSGFEHVSDLIEYVVVNDRSRQNIGDLTPKVVKLSPYEGVVLKSIVPAPGYFTYFVNMYHKNLLINW